VISLFTCVVFLLSQKQKVAEQVMNCIMEGLQHLGRTLQREKLNCFAREILSSSWNTMHDQWQVITAYAALIAVTVWMLLGLWTLPQQQRSSGGGVRRKSSLAGPIRWPLLGAAPEVLWNYHRLNDWIVSYLKKSPTMHVQLPNVTFTYTALPENVEHILKNNFSNYPKVQSCCNPSAADVVAVGPLHI
jgi:hypothetical protein